MMMDVKSAGVGEYDFFDLFLFHMKTSKQSVIIHL